jgi:AraC-like DNA-binding protein
MAAAHDPSSENLDPAAGAGALGDVDPLSDVLRTVKLRGALFFLVDATSPWCVEVPAARAFADIILPRARQVISYHVAVAGRGLAGVHGDAPVAVEAGDIIVFPHGDPYRMASAPEAAAELDRQETLQFFRDLAAGRLPFIIKEGGGRAPSAQFVCSFLACDLTPYNPILSALPRLLHVRRSDDTPSDLLDRLVELTIAEAQANRVGAQTIRLGLSELMFVEVLRRHLAAAPTERPNWLTALRDPIVGRAITRIHSTPSARWTLDQLARETGTSRSVLSERFAATVGLSPGRYVTMWRLQIAARLLADETDKISSIAERIGFSSEAAFSRAFKRATGQSPANWRATSRPAG